jgi:hypothetical protein
MAPSFILTKVTNEVNLVTGVYGTIEIKSRNIMESINFKMDHALLQGFEK